VLAAYYIHLLFLFLFPLMLQAPAYYGHKMKKAKEEEKKLKKT
jgi:hypothetical protein